MAKTFMVQNGDVVIDQATGRPIMVTERDKTRQDLGELLAIEIQDNGFGAGIIGLVGDVPRNPYDLAFRIMSAVTSAVNRWIVLLREQRANRSDEEIVTRTSFNQAKVDEETRTKVNFRVDVETRAGPPGIVRTGTISAG